MKRPPQPGEYVDKPRGQLILPEGSLFIKEIDYWQDRHEAAEEAGDENNRELADLMCRGLGELAIALTSINRHVVRPGNISQGLAAMIEWYEWSGQTFGNSRLMRSVADVRVATADDEKGGQPIEMGVDIVELPIRPMATIAIHAAAEGLANIGIEPVRRHRDNWFKNEEHGLFVKATNPSLPSPDFRARFNEINGRAFDSTNAFTLRGFLMMREWTARG